MSERDLRDEQRSEISTAVDLERPIRSDRAEQSGRPLDFPADGDIAQARATLQCQFDAFAEYVREAEANGAENYHLYEWTRRTIEDPAKQAKYTKSFSLHVDGDEVYEKDKADALEAELKPLVGGPIVLKMFRYDTDPAHNPQPPRQDSASRPAGT